MIGFAKRFLVVVSLMSALPARAWVDTQRYPGHDTPGAALICAGADVAMTGFLTALTSHFYLNRPGSPVLKHAVKIRNVGGALVILGAVGAVAAYAAAAYKYGGNFDSGRCYLTRARFHSTRSGPESRGQNSIIDGSVEPLN